MSKKGLELHWLELARDIRPDPFDGELVAGEAPDFVLTQDGSTTGVEVTRYSSHRRQGEPIQRADGFKTECP
jgi:hypothetical protein